MGIIKNKIIFQNTNRKENNTPQIIMGNNNNILKNKVINILKQPK